METPPAKPHRKRFQYSLLSLLSFAIALGAVMGFVFSQLETNRLRAENRKLREELGALVVDDPGKFYARALPVNDQLTWRWRIYFPGSRRYTLNIQTGLIGEKGWANGNGSANSITAEKGEYTFEVNVRKISPGHVEIHLATPDGLMITTAETTQPGFDDWAFGSSSSTQLDGASRAYDPDRPLELLRLRAGRKISPTTTASATGPSPGLLIWMEPEIPPQNTPASTPAPGPGAKPAGK